MRVMIGLGLMTAAVVAAGCGPAKPFDGPTVDAFNGQLTHGGKAVAFAEGETVFLDLMFQSEKPEQFKIPIKSDGTFKIGWMPIGKYTATLLRGTQQGKAPPSRFQLKDGLTIEEGQTEYQIDLGNGWKP